MRDKWDKKRGATTYGQRTINKAITDTIETFNSSRDTTAKNVYGFNQENTTIKQLKNILRNEGLEQRQLIKEQNVADGHPKKKAILNFRRVTSILEKYILWAVVGNNQDEWQKSALYFYNPESGIYEKNNLLIEELINTVEPQITEKNIKEVKSKLRIEGKRKYLTNNSNLYVLGNGIFDAQKHQLLNYSPKYVFTSKIAVNYNPDAQEPRFDNWSFSKWINEDIAENKEDKIKLIWQTFKAVVNSNYSYHSAVFLLDAKHGSAGKGTFEQLLENIAGEGNYASIKLNEFEKDAILATIVNKPLVIGDDNDPNKPIDSSERFKSASTGDSIPINDKYEKAYSYKPTCLIVQSLNDLPKFKDNSDATYRRIRVIKFNKHYAENASNRKIKDEYIYNKDLLEWIVKTAIDVKIDGVMVHTEESNAILKENKIDSEPFLQFVNDIVILNENGYRFQDTTYQAYRTWYKNTGHNIFCLESFRDFNKKMREHGFKQRRRMRGNHKLQVWLNIQLNTDSMNLTYMDVKDTKDTKDTKY
ncbi:DNA primase [Lactobacillus gallinarum]|nr:DNA primase [Lactobacillus gallinarum]